MPSVLFVCTANRCRSPVAVALLKTRAQKMVLGNAWRVESAGTWAKEGLPAIEPVQVLMKERGIDISAHRSRMITTELLEAFKLVLVMESGQKEALQIEFPKHSSHIYMLSEMCQRMQDIREPTDNSREGFISLIAEIEGYINFGYNRILRLTLSKSL